IDTAMSHGLPTPRPFMISSSNAASVIKRKIDAGCSYISVPWQFWVIRKVCYLLPDALVDPFLVRSHKDALKDHR
ncbi:hypothetical protein ABTJ77_18795, partial [Acinetobacter baumannii]